MNNEYFNAGNSKISISSVFEKMRNFELSISDELKKRIENPIEAYIEENLPLKEKDPIKRKKKEEFLRKNFDKEYIFDEKFFKDRVREIFNKYDSQKSFDFLSDKEARILFRYDILWATDEFDKYKKTFIKHVMSSNRAYKYFRNILQLYIRQYLKLKNYSEFKELFKDASEKYNQNKKYSPEHIKNLLLDCDNNIFKKNIAKNLALKCINERKKDNSDRANIIEIIKNRYRYVRPNTDLFSVIIEEICEICQNKLKEKDYFNLIFKEILIADIDNQLSGKLVSEIIKLFGEDKDVSLEDLQEIKRELFKNPNYGDPRITKSEKNWHYVDEKAKHIFITWLAQADLEFFFKIAFKGIEDPHGRKVFWQQYINSNELVESHVIWSQKHYNSAEIKKERDLNKTEYKYFVKEDDCSCFILKFNDIYVVEYSIINNAVFIYDSNKFINITKSYFWDRSVLKQQGAILFSQKDIYKNYNLVIKDYEEGIFKVSHYSKWENVVEKILQENGIYRG